MPRERATVIASIGKQRQFQYIHATPSIDFFLNLQAYINKLEANKTLHGKKFDAKTIYKNS